jgi:PAS domain S-box-containing protein
MVGDTDTGRLPEGQAAPCPGGETTASDYPRLLERVPAIIYVADVGGDGRWYYVSPQIEQILGYSPAEWCADPELWFERLHPEDRIWVLDREHGQASAGLEGPDATSIQPDDAVEYRMVHRNGRVVWIRDDAVLARGEDGELRWHGVLSDITERKHAEAELERRAAQQAAVAVLGEHALEGASTGELMEEAVSSATKMLGVEIAAVWEFMPEQDSLILRSGLGWPDSAIGTLRYPAGAGSQAGYTLQGGLPVIVEDWDTERRFAQPAYGERRTRAGLSVKIEGRSRGPFGVLIVQSMEPRGFAPGDIDFLQALANVLADALERQAIEDGIRERALHDPLTGLPNRELFVDRLDHAWPPGGPGGDPVPRPRPVQAGQRQPRPSGRRRAAGGGRAEAAPGPALERHRGPVRRRRIRDPARGHRVRARRDRDGRADRRDLRSAVRAVRQRALRDHEHRDRARRRRRARRRPDPRRRRGHVPGQGSGPGPLRVLRRDHADGGGLPARAPDEALLRWHHPQRGEIPPGEFVPIAEENGLIEPIGRWVLEQACHQAAEWYHARPDSAPINISVNLSAVQVTRRSLPSVVQSVLRATGVDPACLSLEITETVMVRDADGLNEVLHALKALGVRLVLDDFGTGYSSLSYLTRLPLDVLKVDRSFVDGLGREARDTAITETIIAMSRALSLDVVAEGVETSEHVSELRRLGCNLAQGFHFSRAVPAAEITAALRDGPRWLGNSARTSRDQSGDGAEFP